MKVHKFFDYILVLLSISFISLAAYVLSLPLKLYINIFLPASFVGISIILLSFFLFFRRKSGHE